ncbi:hypothetical protein Lesp01_73290 [Lentzea sp. NBRC 102530]|nr:hypothetical protein Lesp01_73290 [Lentzea sp. NBRC 102530]
MRGSGALRAVVVPAAVRATTAAAPVARNVRREGMSCSGMSGLRVVATRGRGLGLDRRRVTLASKPFPAPVTVQTKTPAQNATWASLSGFAMS